MVLASSDEAELSSASGSAADVDVDMVPDHNKDEDEDDEEEEDLEEEESEEDDSDRELQVALKEGLLKSDKLNYIVEKKRPIINKKAEIEAKIEELEKKLPWLETLDVTVSNDRVAEKAVNDDFEREIIFYKQAEKAVHVAVPRLRQMGMKVFRPTDYYAEMVKSDQHMQKVRQRMADLEENKQKQEAIRRIREEKKFAAKVQKEVVERKQNEKKMLLEAVKKHRKGMKSQLDVMLNNARRLQDADEEEEDLRNEKQRFGRVNLKGKRDKKKLSRIARDRKFGFGGQKKRSKKNDKNSFEEFATPGGLARKLKGRHTGALFSGSAKRRKQRRK